MTRILGYVMARDEWPMLGFAISHALNLVDHVVVVDHASIDQTPAGLHRMQQAWPSRITVLRLNNPEFLEEETTCITMKACKAEEYDWVYIFDADEFLLVNPASSLKSILQDLPSSTDAVRYDVQNWICPTDFDPTRIKDFTARFRRADLSATPTNIPAAEIVRKAYQGQLNFFDIPFQSKLIVRAKHAYQLAVGSHSLKSTVKAKEVMVNASEVRCGHLPFYSKDRLQRKAKRGENLVKQGFPPEYGWQSQVIYRVAQKGRLDDFWDSHTIQPKPKDLPFKAPDSCEDQDLGHAIDRALHIFTKSNIQPQDPSAPNQNQLDLDALIRLIYDLNGIIADQEQIIARNQRRAGSRIKGLITKLQSTISASRPSLGRSRESSCYLFYLTACLLV